MMANIRLLNPDYEYLFFDEERVQAFIDREFLQYRTVFDSFQYPIQRYDFFRYLAVLRHGGFYFDLDVLLASGLSDLLEFGCVFPFEGLTFSHYLRTHHNMDWEIGNYAFGAAAGHPFLEAIIQNCMRAQRDPGWVKPMMRGMPFLSKSEYFVLNTTGPGLVSRTLAENPDLAKTVRVLFPDNVCNVDNWNRFGNLGIHLMNGSWRPRSGYVLRRLAQRWEALKMQRLLKQSLRLGTTRHHVQEGDPRQLGTPFLAGKYSWLKSVSGWRLAKSCPQVLLNFRWSLARSWDDPLFHLDKIINKLRLAASRPLIRIQNRYRRDSARHFSRRPFAINTDTPLISFTFDDFPRSALLTGGAILQSFGLAGSYYASLGLIGRHEPTGPIFLPDDLKVLLEQGHELGSHTFSHCDAWDTQPDAFEDEVIRNQQALSELVPGASFKTFSYPISVPRARTKKRISKYFSCCRCGGQTFNTGNSDLNYLSAFFLEKSRDNPGIAKNLIDRNRQARGWLIFATHDICKDPTRWGCTPDYFEEIVRYAVKSGARILPVFQAYRALRG